MAEAGGFSERNPKNTVGMYFLGLLANRNQGPDIPIANFPYAPPPYYNGEF